VADAEVCDCDRWHLFVLPWAPLEHLVREHLPPALAKVTLQEASDIARGTSVENVLRELGARLDETGTWGGQVLVGTFQNYFSVGLDAQVAFGFHQMRESRPWLFKSQSMNKLMYLHYGCTKGGNWCLFNKVPVLTPSVHLQAQGRFRGRRESEEVSEPTDVPLPKGTRQLIFSNVTTYGGGSNVWGRGGMEKYGLTPAKVDDGLLEVSSVRNAWHQGMIVGLGRPFTGKRIMQSSSARLHVYDSIFMQVDGEPWFIPPCTVLIAHAHSSKMLRKKEPQSGAS
jgi:hypothetical protein